MSLTTIYFKVGTDPDVASVNVQNRVTTVLDELSVLMMFRYINILFTSFSVITPARITSSGSSSRTDRLYERRYVADDDLF